MKNRHTIVVLGELGTDNLGDELGNRVLASALSAAFQQEGFQSEVLVSKLTAGVERASAVVLGCGTLLDKRNGRYVQALKTVSDSGAVIAVIGSGQSDPLHLPPTEEGVAAMAAVRERCVFYAERGNDMPDPMWLLGWRGGGETSSAVGVNVGIASWCHLGEEWYAREMESLASRLRAHWRVTDIDVFPRDRKYPLPADERNLLTADDHRLPRCDTVVAFRGHLGVLAACAGKRVFAIDWHAKIRQMYRRTDVQVTFLSDLGAEDWLAKIRSTPHFDNEAAVATAAASAHRSITTAARAIISRLEARHG